MDTSHRMIRHRPPNVAVLALAREMARTARAMAACGRAYRRDRKSTRPGGAAAQAAGA